VQEGNGNACSISCNAVHAFARWAANLGAADAIGSSGRSGTALNENFKTLHDTLDDTQTGKLRDMQRVWIRVSHATCNSSPPLAHSRFCFGDVALDPATGEDRYIDPRWN